VPNIKSSKKDLRRSRRRTVRNADIRSEVKTAIKRARTAIESKEPEAAAVARSAARLLDKAATKGTIHKRAAARQKSRLAKRLGAGQQPSARPAEGAA
jgi:small subunit ribosomal protein S20